MPKKVPQKGSQKQEEQKTHKREGSDSGVTFSEIGSGHDLMATFDSQIEPQTTKLLPENEQSAKLETEPMTPGIPRDQSPIQAQKRNTSAVPSKPQIIKRDEQNFLVAE